MNTTTPVYQLKITLRGSRPAIWRRLRVLSSDTLGQLHDTVQISMGWTNSHLHMFVTRDGKRFGDLAHDDDGIMELLDESAVTVGELLRQPKQSLVYEYDFGDCWEHEVALEKVLPPADNETLPKCLHGAGQCPPEDVGGLPGYYAFLEAVLDPTHPEHDDLLAWYGEPVFDPQALDLENINRGLQDPVAALYPEDAFEDDFHGLSPEQMHLLLYHTFDSPALLQWHLSAPVEQAPALRMAQVLLKGLADKDIKLTPKGNLPAAWVRAMLEAGGYDELMGHWRGSIRSEDDAMPVHVTRLVVELARLTKKQKGKLSLTKKTASQVAKGHWGEIYLSLLKAMMTSFNWAYLDGHDEVRGVQMTAPFGLWLLQLYGQEWRPEPFYTEAFLQAFPMLPAETSGTHYHSPADCVGQIISWRLCRLFHWFGLIERHHVEPTVTNGLPVFSPSTLRRTGLFEGVLKPMAEMNGFCSADCIP